MERKSVVNATKSLISDILPYGYVIYEVEQEIYFDEKLNKPLVHLDCTPIKKVRKMIE